MSCRCAETRPPRERGVALITVLLVFVLATLMATQMLRAGRLATHRTGNLVDTAQARYYALGAEELARQMLRQDARGGGVDHLGETWASEGLAFEIEDGQIEIEIQDLAGRFNLNSLAGADGRASAAAIERLARLLRQLDIAPEVAAAVADWQDADAQTARGASETATWGVAWLPNRPLVEASELRALPAIDAAAWERLAPHVAALPPEARLNLNTATAEVLLAYAERASLAQVERFLHARTLQPVRDAQERGVVELLGEAVPGLDVRSEHFLVRAHAQYRGRHVRLDSRLQRDTTGDAVRLIGRADGTRL